VLGFVVKPIHIEPTARLLEGKEADAQCGDRVPIAKVVGGETFEGADDLRIFDAKV
jgi:hypothetical protein